MKGRPRHIETEEVGHSSKYFSSATHVQYNERPASSFAPSLCPLVESRRRRQKHGADAVPAAAPIEALGPHIGIRVVDWK